MTSSRETASVGRHTDRRHWRHEETTSIGSIYTLASAQRITGANRNLITFLIRDRQIPTFTVGKAKVLDESGLDLLSKAIDEYQSKAEATIATA